jgi:hypothetical protein
VISELTVLLQLINIKIMKKNFINIYLLFHTNKLT